MKTIIASVLTFILLNQPSQAFTDEYITTLDDQQSISLTIYNQNLALIKDRRAIILPEGSNTLAFREVSARMKPETALLSSKEMTVLEQNFEFDMLTPQALLQKYVGKEVTVIKTHPTTGEETGQKARVLSANNGVVLQVGDSIETGTPGRLVFGNLPGNLRDRPTLTMLVENRKNQSQNIELSYLTEGLGWQADYVAELNETDGAMDISGWVTLTNTSGASYQNADLQLVAGDINQVEPERQAAHYVREKTFSMATQPDGMAEEQMFEYHLYSLDRPTTIKDNQTKQVALLQAGNVPCRKEFLLQGNSHYYQSQYGDIGKKIKIAVFVEVENRKENMLGLPLPKGVVRVYKKDSRGRLQFVGEDRIDHTPENESLRLKLGDSFDITANKKQTDFKKISGFSSYNYVYESAYHIELKNGRKEAATVKISEPIPGDWEILQESSQHQKETSNRAVWFVEVPPLDSTALTYRVRVKF